MNVLEEGLEVSEKIWLPYIYGKSGLKGSEHGFVGYPPVGCLLEKLGQWAEKNSPEVYKTFKSLTPQARNENSGAIEDWVKSVIGETTLYGRGGHEPYHEPTFVLAKNRDVTLVGMYGQSNVMSHDARFTNEMAGYQGGDSQGRPFSAGIFLVAPHPVDRIPPPKEEIFRRLYDRQMEKFFGKQSRLVSDEPIAVEGLTNKQFRQKLGKMGSEGYIPESNDTTRVFNNSEADRVWASAIVGTKYSPAVILNAKEFAMLGPERGVHHKIFHTVTVPKDLSEPGRQGVPYFTIRNVRKDFGVSNTRSR